METTEQQTTARGATPPGSRSRAAGSGGGRWWLALAGVLAGGAALGAAEAVAWALRTQATPLESVAALVRDLTPGPVVELALGLLGTAGKPVLLVGTVLLAVLLVGWAAGAAPRRPLLADGVFVLLGAVGLLAVVLGRAPATPAALAVLVGAVTGVLVLRLLAAPLVGGGDGRRVPDRRLFLQRAGLVALGTAVAVAGGRVAGGARRGVEASRRLLRLDVTPGAAPSGADLGVVDAEPWRTPNEDFYLIHTALAAPAVRPEEWRLRIHGRVGRELSIGYEDLLRRGLSEAWVTLCCVSNPVGGDLIGNAWWSGVPVRELLAEAGVDPDADAVLQTSADGWTCSTPLAALTDERDALLAVAMNGQPLPVDHGFPVRMVVPGLYGYVSATKWLVDLEVTRFEDVSAYWTERGWAERGPVKTQSRIEVPRTGTVSPGAGGEVVLAGTAWAQHTGVAAVEVQVDGGPWQRADLGAVPSADTWVQWSLAVQLGAGEHEVRCRATDRDGETQTAAETDVIPDGATGWHSRRFTVA